MLSLVWDQFFGLTVGRSLGLSQLRDKGEVETVANLAMRATDKTLSSS